VADKFTNCQQLNVGEQLRAGARYFDIRPAWNGQRFVTNHMSAIGEHKVLAGALGQSLSDIISQVNTFTANHAEMIILDISHIIDAHDAAQRELEPTQYAELWNQLKGINALFKGWRPTEANRDITTVSPRTFIGNNKPAVLLRCAKSDKLGSNGINDGFFPDFPLYDTYAEKLDIDSVSADQLDKMSKQRTSPSSEMFLLSWTRTAGLGDWVRTVGTTPSEIVVRALAGSGEETLLTFAARMNDRLVSDMWPKCSNSCYPNVLLVDALPNDGWLAALALAINWQFGS
jgi:hypothetical protein